MVVGFAVVLGVTLLTTLLAAVLSFCLHFFAFRPFAVLIIFQPELRRLLAELGNLPMFNTTREEREYRSDRANRGALSEARIGALIAIEQAIQLQEVVESGILGRL